MSDGKDDTNSPIGVDSTQEVTPDATINPKEEVSNVEKSSDQETRPEPDQEQGSPKEALATSENNETAPIQVSQEEVNEGQAEGESAGEDGKKKRKKLKKHKEKKSKKDKKNKKKKKKKNREERGHIDPEDEGIERYEEDELNDQVVKKAPRRRSKKRQKLRDTTEGGEEGGDILSDEERAPGRVGLIDQLIKTGKSRRGRVDEHQIDDEVQQLKIEMKRAYEHDQRSNQAGKPALAKLKMLDRVVNFLKRSSVLNAWTEDGGMNVICLWLQKLPDGSYPNMSIRTKLLDCLPDMPVEVSQLKESGVGRVIMDMVNDPLETPENKKIARGLVTKWSRIIFGMDSNYASLDPTEEFQEVPQNYSRQQTISRQNTGDDFDVQDDVEMASARIVERNVKSYRIRPVSSLSERRSTETFENDSSVNRIKKRMQAIMRSNTQSKSRMSIEGKD